jgi:hypothetical protein
MVLAKSTMQTHVYEYDVDQNDRRRRSGVYILSGRWAARAPKRITITIDERPS